VDFLGKKPMVIKHYRDIPFMPIGFFKSHRVVSGDFEPEIVFTSSGTTGITTSRHHIKSVELYIQSFMHGFRHFFGSAEQYTILALLPSYLEREGSSLVLMADQLIKRSHQTESGFFLHNYNKLADILVHLKTLKKPTILLGVTYALLDMAEQFPLYFPELIVMETGGMKGKRKEMVRDELHQQLMEGFGIDQVFSEYGMTELLSQAYSKGHGVFYTPPWMKILIRDTNDPLSILPEGQSGGINVIDLANIYSCSFIETQDLGRSHSDGSFEILGRFDNSDIRGCNLLIV
jgi:phenylacetate-coenzyme A ligase PaaK-like adenylate-forming protein